jgi:L-ribulose-5-phosphate 4-epimerase
MLHASERARLAGRTLGQGSARKRDSDLRQLASLRAEVARYARKMHDSGLVRATQGNLSARDSASGLICVTPSGADYETLTGDDIVVVTASGEVVAGRWRPSVEAPAHLEVYRRRADVGCVMHTHSIYATVFGVVCRAIPTLLAESAYCLGGEVPIAPYQESGTAEFAKMVVDLLGDGPAVIWGNHGAMVVGRTVALAYSVGHALEDSARVYWLASQVGQPRPLPEGEAQRLHAAWLSSYGQRPLNPSDET